MTYNRPEIVRIPARPPIPFDGGIPDTIGLPVDRIVVDGNPYMNRYYLLRTTTATIRLHEILSSDPGRALHDHPWDFVSLLLVGSYVETLDDGTRTRYATPSLLTRRAETAHRLDLDDGPVWTFVTTGTVRRQWGFHTPEGWISARDYPDAGTYEHERGGLFGRET